MSVHLEKLRVNALETPLGIDTPQPEFAWQLAGDRAEACQTAYALQVASDGDFSNALIWDTGHIEGDAQFGVIYNGEPLSSCQRYYWRVRVWDENKQASDWSAPSWFEMGILDANLWQADWVTLPVASTDPNSMDDAVVYLRANVTLAAPIRRARVYVSALGWYRFFVNGVDITGNALVPRWTPAHKVLEYQAYDVTEHLKEGCNVIAMAIGDGRYRGKHSDDRRGHYGDRLAGLAQLQIEQDDGNVSQFASDASWLAGSGRILSSDPMSGEIIDLRISDADWLNDETAPARFASVEVLAKLPQRLIAQEVQPVQEIERLNGRVQQAPSGKQIIDFGQNFSGVVQVRLPAGAGRRIKFTYSELLDKEGELDVKYIWLGGLKLVQRDEVILADTTQIFQPWFTIHGFRYVEIDGLDSPLSEDDISAIVLSSDLPSAGQFDCSDARLNQLHRNVVWGLRSNFTDTPTDCPTRERSGWTGDINVFASTAMKLVNSQPYLRRYLRNLGLEQLSDGRVPPFIPLGNGGVLPEKNMEKFLLSTSSSVGWGDVSVMLPWCLYQYYGDKQVLGQSWGAAKAWVDYLVGEARNKRGKGRWFSKRLGEHDAYIIGSGYHWGEWLRPHEGVAAQMATSLLRGRPIVATAYYAHSTQLLGNIAEVLGKDDEAQLYTELSKRVRVAWCAAFIHPNGRIGEDKQDDYVRALAFDLIPTNQRPAAVARLVELIKQANYHLGTGFLSTPMLLRILADNGEPEVAYRLLMQTSCPSWLYQIEQGATTTWETWEGYDKKGNAKMSHNHYAFGSVVNWFYEGICGVSPAEPGYRRIRIAPVIGGDLSHANCRVETPFGEVSSGWQIRGDQVQLKVVIPGGASADIHLGDGCIESVESGGYQFQWPHSPSSNIK